MDAVREEEHRPAFFARVPGLCAAAAFVLALGLVVSACGDDPPLDPPPLEIENEPPGADGPADFSWSVAPRLVRDRSGELVPYPQAAAELPEFTFEVLFRFVPGACQGQEEPKLAVDGAAAEPARLGDGCAFRISFAAEGSYEIEARAAGQTRSEQIVVNDLLIVSIGDSVASGEGNPEQRSGDKPRWRDRRCHRSSAAGSVGAAELVEAADVHSSVTLVHLGCSGATIPEGLIGPYEGIETGPNPLPPQLEELGEIAAATEVDAVLLNVGANDIGFSDTVKACAKTIACQNKAPADRVSAALGQLPDRYDELAAALPAAIPPSRVHAIEYFDPTHDKRGRICDGILFGIGEAELRWARDEMLGLLNLTLQEAASRHGWSYVGGVSDAYLTHGYCSDDSWVRRLGQSLFDGNLVGTLHPNRAGHAATAALISRALIDAAPSAPILTQPVPAESEG